MSALLPPRGKTSVWSLRRRRRVVLINRGYQLLFVTIYGLKTPATFTIGIV